MSRLSRPILLTFAAAVVVGACLHFLYDLFPCTLTALIAPVSESLWEHGKLLYWPSLAVALLTVPTEGRRLWGARACSLLLGMAFMLVVGFLYHIPLGGESLLFDIVLYVLSMAICLLLPYLLDAPVLHKRQDLFLLLALALGAALVVFTFLPPTGLLFTDLSGVNTWSIYPY